MELVAWLTHKYIMRYILVFSLKITTLEKTKVLKNDFFFLIFALPGSILTMYGIEIGIEFSVLDWFRNFYLWNGLFFVHDLFIHQRIKVLKH